MNKRIMGKIFGACRLTNIKFKRSTRVIVTNVFESNSHRGFVLIDRYTIAKYSVSLSMPSKHLYAVYIYIHVTITKASACLCMHRWVCGYIATFVYSYIGFVVYAFT